jgi:hypothetical protein
MTELLLLRDISQLEDLDRVSPECNERCTLVTGDLAVAAELERRGIPFVEEWSYVDANDLTYNWDEAHHLAAAWWDPRWGQLELGDLSLPSMTLQDMVYPFEACLNAELIYRRLFAALDVSGVRSCPAEDVAFCRTGPAPGYAASASIASAVMRWFADTAGVPFLNLKPNRPDRAGQPLPRSVSLKPSSPESLGSGRGDNRVVLVTGWCWYLTTVWHPARQRK